MSSGESILSQQIHVFSYSRFLWMCESCQNTNRHCQLSYNVTYPRATKIDTKAWCALMRQRTHLRYDHEDRLHAIYIRSGNYLPVLFALPFFSCYVSSTTNGPHFVWCSKLTVLGNSHFCILHIPNCHSLQVLASDRLPLLLHLLPLDPRTPNKQSSLT